MKTFYAFPPQTSYVLKNIDNTHRLSERWVLIHDGFSEGP